MNGNGEEVAVYEIAVVVSKSNVIKDKEIGDCVDILVAEFRNVGLIVDIVSGVSDEFIKVAAPPVTLGRAAAEIQLKKPTRIGDFCNAAPDFNGVLLFFSHYLFPLMRSARIPLFSQGTLLGSSYSNLALLTVVLILNMYGHGYLYAFPGLCVHHKYALESLPILNPAEMKRKKLLRSWALNWWDLTDQPIDEIYSYFGTKVAIYFAFLGKYTQWLFFPAALGLIVQLVDFGSLQLLALPVFFISITLWAVLFFQFWKRKNYALLARWQINCTIGIGQGHKLLGMEWSYRQPPVEVIKTLGTDKAREKELYQRNEWLGHLMRFRNDVFVILSIICLQLPFELAYAHLYEVIGSDIIKTLRQVLIQRLIISEVLENLLENSLPYIKYSYKKYKTIRVEKEYLKPAYSASIVEELEDGLFDDFLELALQFGMIMMFACAFPLAFAFAAVNNIMEIRTDALKLLSMFKRPVPRDAVTIGAWINIFQFLIVMSICTNSALLVWLYDQEGKWKIEPGLAAILIMEHVLLLIKFGFSHFVPEEPAWVRANRVRNATQAQDVCSKQLLRTISGEKTSNESKKNE
ncbi:Anoctamin-like protein [Citrus sinensis]|uniref:Anoctamin-like protein n=1 Tax=Citrus sinensis TaxID=2711 RepID=A0ACB8J8D7_CITSI|nr:Anoctamin-like protein [Citrus sinensis]